MVVVGRGIFLKKKKKQGERLHKGSNGQWNFF